MLAYEHTHTHTQVAEENGMDVLSALAENPVSSKEPQAKEGADIQTLTTAQEDNLSTRYITSFVKILMLCPEFFQSTIIT